jgi:hypothetical protein
MQDLIHILGVSLTFFVFNDGAGYWLKNILLEGFNEI